MDSLLSLNEAAEKLRKSPSWLQRAAASGLVPSRKVGVTRLFTEADLQDFIDRSAQGTDPWARSTRSAARRRT